MEERIGALTHPTGLVSGGEDQQDVNCEPRA